MVIPKSVGSTTTEKLLAELCDRTFLKLWSYPNPFKDDGKEFCDLLVVFEDHVIIFFDRESHHLDKLLNDPELAWKRWKRNAVDAQILTANGAERYLKSGRKLYLDSAGTVPLPISCAGTLRRNTGRDVKSCWRSPVAR